MRHPSDPWPEKSLHTTTQWVVSPSLKYDALCALDMLSGDPFYLKFYRDDYNRLAPRLTPQEKNDFVAIKRIIKDKNKGIVSADLALILDPGAIALRAGISMDADEEGKQGKGEEVESETAAQVEYLLVEAAQRQAAIPLADVLRIEQIPMSRIEYIVTGRSLTSKANCFQSRMPAAC